MTTNKKDNDQKNNTDNQSIIAETIKQAGKIITGGTKEEENKKKLEKELIEKLEKEVEEYKNKWLRAEAENENLRKRFTKDITDAREYAIAEMAKDVADLKENFRLAKGSIDKEILKNDHAAAMYKGIEMIDKLFDSLLKNHDIKQLIPIGEMFDHNYHQAIKKVTSTSHPSGSIVEVIRSGYLLKNRLLSPAIVAVAEYTEDTEDTIKED